LRKDGPAALFGRLDRNAFEAVEADPLGNRSPGHHRL
jgi:hypothetical protein